MVQNGLQVHLYKSITYGRLQKNTQSSDRLCTTCALGDERHYVFDCPRFAGLRLTHAELFQDASGAMKSLVWHKDQEDVCALLLAIVAQAQT